MSLRPGREVSQGDNTGDRTHSVVHQENNTLLGLLELLESARLAGVTRASFEVSYKFLQAPAPQTGFLDLAHLSSVEKFMDIIII